MALWSAGQSGVHGRLGFAFRDVSQRDQQEPRRMQWSTPQSRLRNWSTRLPETPPVP